MLFHPIGFCGIGQVFGATTGSYTDASQTMMSDASVDYTGIFVIIFPRNVSFREYYVFVSNAAAARVVRRRRRRPRRRRTIVSAIAFEGFKLRSSNLTHALLIQISRTISIIDIVVPSKKKLRIDLKWPEMRSKVICGHSKWPPVAILSKI